MTKSAFGADSFLVVSCDRTVWRRTLIKTLLVMKLTVLLLTVVLFSAHATTVGQKITISGENLTIKAVFAVIEKQTGYVVGYAPELFPANNTVSLSVNKLPLHDFLSMLLKDQPLQYKIADKTIFIFRKAALPAGLQAELAGIDHLIDTLHVVTGTVFNETGIPLSGVSIVAKKTKKGTVTDAGGRFSIQVNKDDILVASYIGYANQEIKVTSSTIIVKLKVSVSMLDETQITAYGKTTRRFATGSIGTVKAEEIERQPVMNVLQALEGKVPGLVITPTSGNSAAPVKVEIRGAKSLNPDILSEPLYVVDGLPLAALQVSIFGSRTLNTGAVQGGRTNTGGENPLLYLNPRDIESIDVLKDVDATAIYGARGANGVILITTKKSKGGATSFSMNISRGSVTIPRKLDLMGTEEYLAVRREAFKNDGIIPTIYNAPDLTLWDQTKYTDWQEYFYKPGSQTTISSGISGGMAQTKFGMNAAYVTQEELNNNGGKNSNASLSGYLSHTSVNRKFQIDFSSRLSISNVVAIPVSSRLLTPPNAPDIYNEKGEFNFEPYRGEYESIFPFGTLKRPSESKTNNIMNSVKLRYEVMKGLNLSITGAYSFAVNDNASFEPLASFDPFYSSYTSMANYGKSTTTNWSVEPQIAYNTLIGKGNLSVQVGGSLQHVINEGITILGRNFPDDNLMGSPNNAALTSIFEGSGEYRFNAGFAIINYRWDNKYIVNLSGRRDGSSKFGPGKQFGNFGSVGLAWLASEEKWINDILPSWFSFLKFAGSYGITGSDAVGDYEYLTRWGTNSSLNSFRKLIGYNGMTAINMLTHTNKNFRWQSTNSLNASITLGFLDDKINIVGTYYQTKSGNQLTLIGTPFYTGFEKVRANWGAVVQNSGIELTLNANLLNTDNWNASVNFNIGKNINKLIKFPGLALSPHANNYEVGKSLNIRYLLKYTGIDPITGDYTFEDHNKDGAVLRGSGQIIRNNATDDRYLVYDLADKFNGGMGVQLSYKSFGLYAGFVFKKALAADPFFRLNVGSMSNMYIPQEVKDNYWKQPGDIAKYPKYTTGALNSNLTSSDVNFQDASFLQMNNLALSYDIPHNIINKIKIRSCRLSVNTQNIFTITSFKGIDPRINSMVEGIPTPRVISTSLSFGF